MLFGFQKFNFLLLWAFKDLGNISSIHSEKNLKWRDKFYAWARAQCFDWNFHSNRNYVLTGRLEEENSGC